MSDRIVEEVHTGRTFAMPPAELDLATPLNFISTFAVKWLGSANHRELCAPSGGCVRAGRGIGSPRPGRSRKAPMMQAHDTATLGGGCFWCLEAVFLELKGVERVVSGYAGGHVARPSYELVCTGTSGHAEVVQVTFDPAVISYGDLLDVFFTIHDPTTLDRQGADIGSQYRSAIFYHSPEQRAEAERKIAELGASGVWSDPIVTQVVPLDAFYPAEAYHQDYYKQNPGQGYCQVVIAPKVAKARKHFLEKLKR
jgi:peptide-methionine (S)-S-oxide reductase